MLQFRFTKEKAVSAVLYITKKLVDEFRVNPDFHKVFKILYFAEQRHLATFGRPITGDHFIAMDHGPVPSNIYDFLKAFRGDSYFCNLDGFEGAFEVRGHHMWPKKDPDLDLFSETDLEYLDESIKENGKLDFGRLKQKSHGYAYNRATKDDKISFRSMAKEAGADDPMLSYMRSISENNRIFTV